MFHHVVEHHVTAFLAILRIGDGVVKSSSFQHTHQNGRLLGGHSRRGRVEVGLTCGLDAGEYIVNAVLAGNENYTGSDDTKTFKVVKLQSQLTINVSDITADMSETIRVNVTEGATGVVVISIDGKDYHVEINGKYAALTLTNLTGGEHKVHAKYLGNEKYNETDGLVNLLSVDDAAVAIMKGKWYILVLVYLR